MKADEVIYSPAIVLPQAKRKCRVCGCSDDDCRQCIEKTGEPCYWVEQHLCSACAEEDDPEDDEPNMELEDLLR